MRVQTKELLRIGLPGPILANNLQQAERLPNNYKRMEGTYQIKRKPRRKMQGIKQTANKATREAEIAARKADNTMRSKLTPDDPEHLEAQGERY